MVIGCSIAGGVALIAVTGVSINSSNGLWSAATTTGGLAGGAVNGPAGTQMVGQSSTNIVHMADPPFKNWFIYS